MRLFSNKGFHAVKIPIGSQNKHYAQNLRCQTSISNMLIGVHGLYQLSTVHVRSYVATSRSLLQQIYVPVSTVSSFRTGAVPWCDHRQIYMYQSPRSTTHHCIGKMVTVLSEPRVARPRSDYLRFLLLLLSYYRQLDFCSRSTCTGQSKISVDLLYMYTVRAHQ